MSRQEANKQVLQDTQEVQSKTKDAIWRIQKQAAETEQIGTATLEQLRKQGQQIDEINKDAEDIDAKLDQASALQNKFDRWAGNWFGGKKRDALKEASDEIAMKNSEEMMKVKEIFQHEKYDSLSRSWKHAGQVLCSNPHVNAPDVFGEQITGSDSNWIIDYNLAGIDPEGWTYAYDFDTLNKKGVGEPTPIWNCYVRRRKWRLVDRKPVSSALAEVKDRNMARMSNHKTSIISQADKIGHVPKDKINLTSMGLTSAGMLGGRSKSDSEDLDEESASGLAQVHANDAEINAGLDSIGNTLDNIGHISAAMKSEVTSQNAKLDTLDRNMNVIGDKQIVVNARLKTVLKHL